MSKIYMHGIDISAWQKGLNLAKYKGQFVIIRAGYGNKADSEFHTFVNQCNRYNIPFGAYWYSYAVNEAQAREEAQQFLNTVKGLNIRVGLWLDMEDADGYKKKHGALSYNKVTAITKAFMNELDKGGYYCGIYSSESWFGTYIKGVSQWDKWVANWGVNNGNINNDTSRKGTLHQYTSKPLDSDVMYVPLSTYTKNQKIVSREIKSIDDVAHEVIAGKWGNGTDRKTRLEQAGYNYTAVQNRVNALMNRVDYNKVATDVIRGNYGNGSSRKIALRKAGFTDSEIRTIQSLVNKRLS